MKHTVYVDDVHITSYANLVLLHRLYSQIENRRWAKARLDFLKESLLRDGVLTCKYCGRSGLKLFGGKRHEKATVDHVTPKSLGGDPYYHANFAVSCNSCNQKKASIPEDMFMASKYLECKRTYKS